MFIFIKIVYFVRFLKLFYFRRVFTRVTEIAEKLCSHSTKNVGQYFTVYHLWSNIIQIMIAIEKLVHESSLVNINCMKKLNKFTERTKTRCFVVSTPAFFSVSGVVSHAGD